jgi:hypothetical protein
LVFLDATGGGPYVVEVLAVAARRVDVELVEAGPAAEDKFLSEVGVVGDLADEAAEE